MDTTQSETCLGLRTKGKLLACIWLTAHGRGGGRAEGTNYKGMLVLLVPASLLPLRLVFLKEGGIWILVTHVRNLLRVTVLTVYLSV